MAGNVGTLDRALRLVIGAALIVAPLINFMGSGANSLAAYAMMTVGGVLALTAFWGLCPIYSLLGIRTKS
jgi:hypothetical protein